MEWLHPEAFYFLLPLGVSWLALALYGRACRRRAADAFVAAAMSPRILPAESPVRFWLKTGLFGAALLLGLIALARPRFGEYFEEVKVRGSDLYVLMDVSKSMLADDVAPSRLERAKSDVVSLLNKLNGERVGLIAFAGKAVVKCPLTTDYGFYRMTLNELDPTSAPRGGTALGDAVRKALEVLPGVADRDQVLLLITDGDDQESYPLEAAAAAAERNVAIISVGLGDTEQGARVPVKAGEKTFVAHEGQPVWSKMNESLLTEMAVKTKGLYVPARTRAYDLSQIYDEFIAKLRGAHSSEHKRSRMWERFQIPLTLTILCLLLELVIRPHTPRRAPAAEDTHRLAKVAGVAMVLLSFFGGNAQAGDARQLVGEGVRLYEKAEYEGAREKFKSAAEHADKLEAPDAAVVAFDLACAHHRKGEVEPAREQYLKAALARDKALAATANFNHGNLLAEQARTLAGAKPEEVEPDKRQKIVDELQAAVAQYRNCLELQADHAAARKNIELIRMWIKVYADKWKELDRRKRREQMDLAQFLDYLIQTQDALRRSTRDLPPRASLDMFAEQKRAQNELNEEIEPLKQKLEQALAAPQNAPPADPKQQEEAAAQKEQARKLLLEWTEAANKAMQDAALALAARDSGGAVAKQKQALEELEKIWSIVVPFRPLLARALAEQRKIVALLQPEPAAVAPPLMPKEDPDRTSIELTEAQHKNARRTSLMVPKAEHELKQAAALPKPAPAQGEPDKNAPQQPDPEKIKAGLKKAIELAPQAVEKMEAATRRLREDKRIDALPDALEAKRILEEIEEAQPKDPNQQKQDQQKKDQQQKNEQDQQKQEQEKKDDKNQPKDPDKKEEQQNAGQKERQQLSREQAEALLRKVREREQDRRRKQKEDRARLLGQMPMVEKDW